MVLVVEPGFKLDRAVGIGKTGEIRCFLQQRGLAGCIDADGISDQFLIDKDAAGVYCLIEEPKLFFLWQYDYIGQCQSKGTFRFDILTAIVFEQFPFCGIVKRQVAGAEAIGLQRLYRHGEITDKGTADRHFLLDEA